MNEQEKLTKLIEFVEWVRDADVEDLLEEVVDKAENLLEEIGI